MAIARGAHLVGGLAASTVEEAMRQTSSILGRHLRRLTDGETSARSQWIWWQIDTLVALPGIRMGEPQVNPDTGNPDYRVFPGLDVEPGVSIPPRALGYADAAIDSYRVFQALRAEGAVPAGVRFQVSVPTPYAVVVAWVQPSAQAAFFDTYKAALLGEIADICGAIPREDLAIQWDVAVEVGVLEPGYFAPLADLRVGDAELALGVIDYENDAARIDALVAAAARSAGRPFAVATECGMSRLGERGESVTLDDLLRQHARVAEPIR